MVFLFLLCCHFCITICNSSGYVSTIVGAGLTAQNVKEQLEFADGAIVGSAFKPNGRTRQMVDSDLVREFMNAVKEI